MVLLFHFPLGPTLSVGCSCLLEQRILIACDCSFYISIAGLKREDLTWWIAEKFTMYVCNMGNQCWYDDTIMSYYDDIYFLHQPFNVDANSSLKTQFHLKFDDIFPINGQTLK